VRGQVIEFALKALLRVIVHRDDSTAGVLRFINQDGQEWRAEELERVGRTRIETAICLNRRIEPLDNRSSLHGARKSNGNPPNREGHCDLDGAVLVQRADDTESVFEERMRTYHSSSAPVIEHYQTLGRFIEMDGDRSIGGIAAGIVAAVDQF